MLHSLVDSADKEILAPPFFILHFKFVHLQEI